MAGKQGKMYADRVEATARMSVKERLNGSTIDDSPRRRQFTGKRQRQDDKWEHDLYEDDNSSSNSKLGSRDLRLKLQRRIGPQGTQVVRASNSGVRDLREKLSGVMAPQPLNVDPPKLKPQVSQPTRKSVVVNVPRLESKTTALASTVAAKKKNPQKIESSVDSFLQSLGLEKYLINLQVEEVDMATLIHMTDEELKTIGIPMGPRKKILMALEPEHKI